MASDSLLIERAGLTPAPQVCAYLWERTAGNPLALSELASTLSPRQLAGREPLPEDLKLGVTLHHSLLARTERFPEPTRTLLLLAAAEGSGDLGLVLRAGEAMGIGAEVIEPAELAGIVRVEGDRLGFRHPLMRAAVYHGAPFGRRRAAHRALAEALTDDPDRRTWHLAAAAVGPDDEVAVELERSADRSRARGAHASAATALVRAADLTSDLRLAGRRLTAAAAEAWIAGREDQAQALLDRAAPMVVEPQDVADVAYVRGLVGATWGDRRAAFDVLVAGAEPMMAIDAGRAARMLVEAGRLAWQDADLAGVVTVGTRLASLDERAEPSVAFAADLVIGLGRLTGGDAAAGVALLREGVERVETDDPLQLHMAGAAAMFAGDDRTARELLARAITRARTLGAAVNLPQTLGTLAALEVWQGSFASAAGHASEAISLAQDTGQGHWIAQPQSLLDWVAAVQGRRDECGRLAAQAIELASAMRARVPVAVATWALALADVGAARWPEAVTRLRALAAPHSAEHHPMVALLSVADFAEAAVRAGLPSVTDETMERLGAFVGPHSSAWTRALLARCRGILDDGSADELFREALEGYAENERWFDEARTHLLLGEWLRRAKRRSDARVHLRSAHEIFERLGAAPWEERARVELRATGETARKREVSTLTDLTPQQMQIARMVAEGASNKEVAARLFLSPRTVDYHLRNVFVKLGIASRAELIRLPEIDEAVHASSL